MGRRHVALTVGSRALGAFEPRQVRKEAALRTPSQVTRHRPARAVGDDTTRGRLHDDGTRGRALDRPGSAVCENGVVTALYRKYRPLDFTQVVGQEAVVRTLRNALQHDQVRQAYLFAGPRGTGKTSMARIPPRRSTPRTGRRPTSTPTRGSRAQSPTGRRSTWSR